MTAAPDSPRPFALPLMIEEDDGAFYVYEKDGKIPIFGGVIIARAEYLIRAVNNYDRMREALEKVAQLHLCDANCGKGNMLAAKFDGATVVHIARTILKEIDI